MHLQSFPGLRSLSWLGLASKTPHLPTFATSGPAPLRWSARNGRSRPLGSARALEMAARASSAPLGRSKWPLDPARLRWGARKMPLELARLCQAARNYSTWLLENTARADVSEVEPARLGWGARHWRSSPLGSPGPETLHWAGPRMLVALNTETNMLRAWYAWVLTSIIN